MSTYENTPAEALYSADAERSVLGACMLNNKIVDRLADILKMSDFAAIENGIIWSAILRLASQGSAVDLVTLSDQLDQNGSIDNVGGLSYLAEIAKNTPSASNAESYARIVAELAQRRRLVDAIGDISRMVNDKGTPVTDIVDRAQGRISSIVRADAMQVGPVGQYLSEDLLDEIDRKWNGDQSAMGISFGLADLDRKTMGMHPGNLVVVGGQSSMGKTAFALNILRSACVDGGKPAVLFSMEMDRKALIQRMTAAIADIPLQAIRDPKGHMTDEYFSRLAKPVTRLKEAKLVVDDRPGLTPSQVRGAAKRWRDHYGEMGLVVVDYIGLMSPENKHGTREQEVAEMSKALKGLAKELQCPVIALSQLNRATEQRPNKRPIKSDLRESGAIEHDADLILFLYRDEVYNENSAFKGVGEIIVAKQREGELGTVYAAARLSHARFDDLSPGAISEMRDSASAPPTRAPKSAMAEF